MRPSQPSTRPIQSRTLARRLQEAGAQTTAIVPVTTITAVAPKGSAPGRLPHASASQTRRAPLLAAAAAPVPNVIGGVGELTVQQVAPLVQEAIRLGLISFPTHQVNDH